MELTFKGKRIFRICRQCGNSIPKTEQLCYWKSKIICQDCWKRIKWNGNKEVIKVCGKGLKIG